MTNEEFLDRIIDDGIEAAKRDYSGDELSAKAKREGSIAGFEACRGKLPSQLGRLLSEAGEETNRLRPKALSDEGLNTYWWHRCYEAEVEWVCNVVSAALMNGGLPVIVNPTARGVFKAAEILGVADEG